MAHPIEIAVISGRGGMGKTVLTSSLARLVDDKVIADCDVDAPNLHLMLDAELKTQRPLYSHDIAVMDRASCNDCGECFRVCRFHAISRRETSDGWSYRVDALSCEGCAVCALACPEKAIEIKKALTGSWFLSETKYGPFVHASLAPARVNTGQLVSRVRMAAKRIAASENLGRILTDGPSGIGCPAIATIAGISLAVVVTEPTVAGFHDFQRVIGLTRCLGLETAVVINKYDLNPEIARSTEDLLVSYDMPLVGKIPFSPDVNEALSDGMSIMDIPDSPVAVEIEKIAWRIVELAEGIQHTSA